MASGEDDEPKAASVQPPSIGIQFKSSKDIVKTAFTKNAAFRQLSCAVWIYSKSPTKIMAGASYILAKKGCFAIGLRSNEIATAFHNTEPGWQWTGTRWKVPCDKWTHVAITYCSSGVARMYVNGNVEFVNNKVKGRLRASTQPLLFGDNLRMEEGELMYFRGNLAYATVWDTVVDVATISAHMHGNISGSEPGIIGHWPMNKGYGNLIQDRSINGYHATMSGTSWWMNLQSAGSSEIPPSTLQRDMKALFTSGVGTDISLTAEGGEVVRAHKIVLAMRSDHFRAMLFGNMKEANQKEISFPDLSQAVLSILIEYLYTDHAEITGKSVFSVFKAADRYQLMRLRSICEDFILKNIDVENVCEIFATADALHADNLRQFCKNWIVCNFGDILLTEEYTKMSADLQSEINVEASFMHFSKKRKIIVEADSEASQSD